MRAFRFNGKRCPALIAEWQIQAWIRLFL